jgi:hypothetical protein
MRVVERTLSKSLNRTETIFLRPDKIDGLFRIDVTYAGDSPHPGEGWHGVIGVDGDLTNGALYSAYSILSMSGELPSTVVVAVSFTDMGPFPNGLSRNTHLTPVPWPEFDEIYCKFYGRTSAPPTGHADVFRDFLAEELQPFIEQEYGVDPAKWTLTGISFGGLFALFTLFTRPTQFSCYNAVSASAWFKKPYLFDLAEQFAATQEPIRARAYLTVGDFEDGVRNDLRSASAKTPRMKPIVEDFVEVLGGTPDQVTETLEIAKIIARRAGCVTKATVMPNETHASVYLVALSQGLRWLHGDSGN